jgi:hypothetical protein
MSTLDPYLVNVNLDVHLRDARHAHQLFTEYGHSFAPKQKFLYHVVFQPSRAVADASLYNTFKFQKEIGVLAKMLDLPSFRASIENKQQYNRKKNVQTRLDYQDIRIVFHDDNIGATRSMLEEYYKWYYVDGSQDINRGGAYNPRDKFAEKVPSYGLNVQKQSTAHEIPFFEYIKIYQLARQQWFSYTLVNPLLSAWQHGDLEYADGAGVVENTITVAYEAVLYDKGDIGDFGEPTNFTSEETRYDNTPSPIGYADQNIGERYNLVPRLLNTTNYAPRGLIARAANTASRASSTSTNVNNQPGVLEQIIVPLRQNNSVSSVLNAGTNVANVESIITELSRSPSATRSFVSRSINTGEVPGINTAAYNALSNTAQQDITDGLVNNIRSNKKLASFAKNAIDAAKGILT